MGGPCMLLGSQIIDLRLICKILCLQSSWTHGGKIYGFGGFGGAPTRFGIIDGDEDDYVQEYPSYLRVVQEYYLWNTRCWNNQVSQVPCCVVLFSVPISDILK